MKYLMNVINLLLVIAIPAFIITGATEKTTTISTIIDVKKINSIKIYNKAQEEIKIPQEEAMPEEKVELSKKVEEEEPIVSNDEVKEVQQETEEIIEEPTVDVIEKLTGKMSGYGPDCNGCRGYTSSGYKITNTVYYNDSIYGNVRILAADRSLEFGTIVKVKNTKLGDFIGIVLDRGGSVGYGKTYLFDLLFTSEKEASSYGVFTNVDFEILRKGY